MFIRRCSKKKSEDVMCTDAVPRYSSLWEINLNCSFCTITCVWTFTLFSSWKIIVYLIFFLLNLMQIATLYVTYTVESFYFVWCEEYEKLFFSIPKKLHSVFENTQRIFFKKYKKSCKQMKYQQLQRAISISQFSSYACKWNCLK